MNGRPTRGSEQCFHYRVFGLAVASELLLPDLLPADLTDLPDIKIRRAAIAQQIDEKAHQLSIGREGALLSVPGAGRYLIRNGNEIIVEPDPQGSDRNMRLFLLGSALGVLLHQRHILPLHANALVFSGKAVAFLGISGAGKSTMAAWFHDRGYPMLTDDVCAVTSNAGRPFVHPGIPRLRLWRDALLASGRSSDGLERSFDDDDKYNVPTSTAPNTSAVPLSAIYHLDAPDPLCTTPSIGRIRGIEAAETLIANTYRGEYLNQLGGVAEHFTLCVDLARQIPIFSVRRRWGIESYAEQVSLLEAHARMTVASRDTSPT